MDMLDTIVAKRREDALRNEERVPVAELRRRASGIARRSLRAALLDGAGPKVVAEMKRSSPSAGVIRELDPAALARRYEEAGACGLSVLTEPHWFGGSEADLRAARAAVRLPVLRKDFIVERYQVYEAAAWGADVVLLIAAALEPAALRDLYECAIGCGLEVLVEAHTEAELESASALPGALLGVNSRDLKTLKTDIGTALRLAGLLPHGRVAIAESGIRTRRDVEVLEAAGYRGFLVGETLLRADDPGVMLRELCGLG
jgi:indole-3-glycerol phosphate synthase